MDNSKGKRFKDDINLLKGGRFFYLTLIICLVVFFGAIGILITAFNRLISRHDQQLSAEISTIMAEKMNSSIEFMTESINSTAILLSSRNYDNPGQIYDILKNNKNADYLSAGFIDQSGEKFASDEEASEFAKWDLLQTAALANPVSISAPYRSSVYGQPVITLFASLNYADTRHGYMFITYKLSELQRIAVTRSLGNDVEIWLMNAESANIIQCAGSDEHSIGSWANAYLSMQDINKEDVPVYSDWLTRIRHLEDNIGISYSVGDTFYSQHCSMISSMPGWYVVVRIPGNALSATMHTFRNYVLYFLAVLLVVVIVLIANMYRLAKRDNEILEALSTYDPLTQVLNRRAFDTAAAKWIARGKDCALIFFDLDYFKQVNDKYGHNIGDSFLTTFSDVLKKNFSENGIISRFGGDEFVVLTDLHSVEEVSALIRKTNSDLSSFKLPGADKKDREFSISFSSGAARFPYDADELPLLKKRADTALYKVKELGRNGYLWYMDLPEKNA
ncbi:MAG: sensor domain-containing diguanylate cyclase [Lachnospiraceae bacterium]|nr:sensor domain-containing diguanylate cyclase [Lachnospiraceae bacterium]